MATFAPIPALGDRLSHGTRYTHVFPALAFARSVFYMNRCFPHATATRGDFAAIVAGYYDRWDTALAEDIEILERQQVGIASPFARAGRSSHLKSAVTHFERWLAAKA
ncbi:MAG: hypothetical protein OEN20_11560, partial [Gammaproteobacteria bacterium]|nr:hypothetical protein [Gammaproteobacteria bacterium]